MMMSTSSEAVDGRLHLRMASAIDMAQPLELDVAPPTGCCPEEWELLAQELDAGRMAGSLFLFSLMRCDSKRDGPRVLRLLFAGLRRGGGWTVDALRLLIGELKLVADMTVVHAALLANRTHLLPALLPHDPAQRPVLTVHGQTLSQLLRERPAATKQWLLDEARLEIHRRDVCGTYLMRDVLKQPWSCEALEALLDCSLAFKWRLKRHFRKRVWELYTEEPMVYARCLKRIHPPPWRQRPVE